MSRAAAILALLLLSSVGCSKTPTQVRIAIFTAGVRVPEDVAAVHLVVADREPAASGSVDDSVYDAQVTLCTEQATAGCYDLPLSAVLFPGKKRAGDSVKVQVDAIGPSGAVVTSDAALFVFSPHQSFQLDFVLYANCIGVTDCAARDQACGPDAQCTSLQPVGGGSTPDLAGDLAGGADLSGAPIVDLSSPPGADLSKTTIPPPVDMAHIGGDMAMCGSATGCAAGHVCSQNMCVACGAISDVCCDTAPQCTTGTCVAGHCSPIVSTGDMMMVMPVDAL